MAFNSSLITHHSSLCIFDGFPPLFEHLAVPDKACARVSCQLKFLCQFQARGRASLLAERAEHTARGIEDEFIEHLLAARLARNRNLYVHRDHVYAIFRTGERAQVTGDAERLMRLRVHVESRRAVKTRR